jgi:hypothetical protein
MLVPCLVLFLKQAALMVQLKDMSKQEMEAQLLAVHNSCQMLKLNSNLTCTLSCT